MKNFNLRTLYFILPIIIFLITSKIYYKTEEGDLIRIGYIYLKSNYLSEIKSKFDIEETKFNSICNIDLSKHHQFDILTIGDSFLQQGKYGLNNYLAYDNLNTLYYNRYLGDNPIQNLINIVNGDLLDSIKVDYIILQCVERYISDRVTSVNFNSKIIIDSLRNITENLNNEEEPALSKTNTAIFESSVVKFPLMNLLYLFVDKPFNSQVYRVPTKQKLFSINKNELLFFEDDINNVNQNNDIESIKTLNKLLNSLQNILTKKSISLIFLPSPDKYDLYYDYIEKGSKTNYRKPVFFEELYKLKKSYIYIDAYKLLKNILPIQKDVYYYSDTHWSPFAVDLISKEIEKEIGNNNIRTAKK